MFIELEENLLIKECIIQNAFVDTLIKKKESDQYSTNKLCLINYSP